MSDTRAWDWGDGTVEDLPLSQTTATHTYADDGTYALTVTGPDASGSAPPVAIPHPTETVVITEPADGATVSVDQSVIGSAPANASLHLHVDGETTEGDADTTADANGQYVFEGTGSLEPVGTYTLTVNVTGDDANSAAVTVTSEAPA